MIVWVRECVCVCVCVLSIIVLVSLAGATVVLESPSRNLDMLSEESRKNTAALDEELFVRPKWKYMCVTLLATLPCLYAYV